MSLSYNQRKKLKTKNNMSILLILFGIGLLAGILTYLDLNYKQIIAIIIPMIMSLVGVVRLIKSNHKTETDRLMVS